MKHIVLRGALFSTGNLGVSALAWSAINLISKKFEGAKICLVGGKDFQTFELRLDGKPLIVEVYPIRFNFNILSKNHILRIWSCVLIRRILNKWESEKRNHHNQLTLTGKKIQTLDIICNAYAHFDITGGDSFSDIYGFSRFTKDALVKAVLLSTGRRFILLPQTYGPFNSATTRSVARYILKRATTIATRDQLSFDYVQELTRESREVSLCPDIAFTLESRKPSGYAENFKESDGSPNVGINVSGLLYNGGYTGRNEFDISLDYRELINEIVQLFVSRYGCSILLVPHVITENLHVENDLMAAESIVRKLPNKLKGQVSIVAPETGSPFYDQCEIKYIIGECDFFLGSRMHATIAALSQLIPTVGLAYSRKFAGVYRTIGVEDCVVDLRQNSLKGALEIISAVYEKKRDIRVLLEETIPQAKDSVHNLFDRICL